MSVGTAPVPAVGTGGQLRPPRILVVAGYYPPHLGGVEACAFHFSSELAALGHLVQVVTSDVGAERGTVDTGGVSVTRLATIDAAHTPFLPGLPLLLWRVAPGTVMHLHLSHVFTDVVGAVIARLRSVPVVMHFHMDVQPSGRLGAVFTAYKRYVLPRVLRSAERVVSLSQEQRALLVSRYGVDPGRIDIVENGVDLDASVPAHLVPEAPEDGRVAPLSLLFVGRLAKQKNVARLLRAVRLLDVPVALHVVGDGELRGELVRLVAELGLSRVVFHGELHGPALQERFHAADVFVMPSDNEGMPLALLEAMAAGLPVLASDVQGLREHVAGRGVLVPDPSPAGFAEAIARLAGDPQWRSELARRGRRYVETLSWPTQTALLAKVLEAADRSRRGRP